MKRVSLCILGILLLMPLLIPLRQAWGDVSLRIQGATVTKIPLDVILQGDSVVCRSAYRELEYGLDLLGLFERHQGARFAKIHVTVTDKEKWQLIFEQLGETIETRHETCSSQSALTFLEVVYERISGIKNFFHTKLAFIGERGSDTKNAKKYLYMMNLNGSQLEHLVPSKDFVLFPKFSRNGKYLSFLSYENYGARGTRPELFVMDLVSRKVTSVYARWTESIGSAVFHPEDDNILIFSLRKGSQRGLYYIDRRKPHEAKPLQYKFGFDVEPTIDPTGTLLAFSSLRTGQPMLYVIPMSAVDRPELPKRLTFVGRYNSAPSFGSDGQWIVFAAFHHEDFDLFKIDPSGNLLFKLTDSQMNDEAPSFSPIDPRHVIFARNNPRGGRASLQMMHIDFPGIDHGLRIPLSSVMIKTPTWSGVINTPFNFQP